MARDGFCSLRIRPVAGCCERCNELSSFMKAENLFKPAGRSQLLKKNSVA
jgi:hypothetical protein